MPFGGVQDGRTRPFELLAVPRAVDIAVRRDANMKFQKPHRAMLPALVIVVVSVMLAACDGVPSAERMARAREFIEQKRPRGAVLELKKVLQEEPDNGQARRLLGSAHLLLGELEDAENQLSRALRLGEEEAGVSVDLGEVWRQQRRHLKIIREVEPKDTWPLAHRIRAMILRANAMLSLTEFSKAHKVFESVLALQPDNVEAVVGLVQVQQNTEDAIKSSAALDAALLIAPDHPQLLGLSADLAFKNGDYSAAASAYRRLKSLSPDNMAARVGLAQALMATDLSDDALAELKAVLKRRPKHPNALYLRTILDARMGDFAVANVHGKSALRASPLHQPSMFLVGLSSYNSGRWKDAHWHLKNLLRANPDHEAAQLLLQATNERLADQANRRDAVQKRNRPLAQDLALFGLRAEDFEPVLNDGVKASENRARTTSLARGYDALVAGNDQQAVESFGRALTMLNDRVAVRSLSMAHYRAGSPAEGRRVLQHWLVEHADSNETRTFLANLFLAEDDCGGALPHLEILVAVDPTDFAALNNLAWCFVRQGDPREALPLAERAYALAGSDPRIMDTLGWILVHNGNPERAIRLLERAAYSESGTPETRLHLAQAHFENTDLESAAEVLKLIMETPDAVAVHHAAAALLRAMDR